MTKIKTWHVGIGAAAAITVALTGTAYKKTLPPPVLIVQRLGSADMYPDPKLSPGKTNAEITQANISETICNKNWKTGSVRDSESSVSQKNALYAKYGIPKPVNNVGQNMVCELDHIISLENGGSDAIENIFPECGPAGAALNDRYFKMKDAVEHYVHNGICEAQVNPKMDQGPVPPKPLTLKEGQGILANDWYACWQKMQKNQACN